MGTTNGYYMLTDAQHKYVHYVDAPPQLFDLDNDPREELDLAGMPEHAPILRRFEDELRTMLDPEAVDQQAKVDQAAKVEAYGGVEALAEKGSFVNSPVPGETPEFRNYK